MLVPTDVPKHNNTFWLSGPGFIKVIQPEPRREILFSGETARLWELIDLQEYTVGELVTRMAEEGMTEERARHLLGRFREMGLITVENFLWKGGEGS